MARYDWHLDSKVLGLSLLTVSPGFSGLGIETEGKRPDQVMRATVETALIGLAGTLITKSWIPLVAPFLYLAAEQMWENSRAPRTINDAVEGNEAEAWQ